MELLIPENRPDSLTLRPMNTRVDAELFDDEFLRKLQGLALLARRMARRQHTASHRSPQRGASVEFAEYRPFQPGDDWRHIDWNAYARWRTLILKLYVEEQDLPVYLLLDNTASMQWGSPVKFDQARRMAAGFAYLSLDRHDRTGLFPLAGKDTPSLPAVRGMGRFREILGLLSACTTRDPEKSLEGGIHEWLRKRSPRGVVVFLSDLWGHDEQDACKAIDRLRYAGHELFVTQMIDPAEQEAGDVGEYRLQPLEGGEEVHITVTQALQEQYRQRVAAYQEQVNMFCRQKGVPLLQADTGQDVIDLLTVTLREKGIVA